MTVHLSARVAWHVSGWNGEVCKDPSSNSFCIGQYSYPGTTIAEERDLDWELKHAGHCCNELYKQQKKLPPCTSSINAFGSKTITAYATPPKFFNREAKTRYWELPPSTVGVWPYEEMYSEDIKTEDDRLDNDARLVKANEYFSAFEKDRSLIFYYANYSNPFSSEEQRRYVIVGISSLKDIGDTLFFDGCSEETKKRFGGGYVWQRNITSHYPNEGFRLPYHLYMDKPDILNKIAVFPENPRNFKYGTRKISDDDALGLVERLLEVAHALKDLGDNSENWAVRITWLENLISNLWKHRGLYPGLTKVLEYLNFQAAIPFFKKGMLAGKEQETKDAIYSFLEGKLKALPSVTLEAEDKEELLDQWKLIRVNTDKLNLLQNILPRFDLLDGKQVGRIIHNERTAYGIYSTLAQIAENPYILSEEYIGDSPDDVISFVKIDHGILPTPNLGGKNLFKPNNWRRLRALLVEHLRAETKHTFLPADKLLADINRRLALHPEWKRYEFGADYLDAYKDDMETAVTFRHHKQEKFAYLKTVREDELLIEKYTRFLNNGSDIDFRYPVTSDHWREFLKTQNKLSEEYPDEYQTVIDGQVQVSETIFKRPIAVLAGAAGTGKTTVIKAIIQAARKAHGNAVSFRLLTPTGKAADRLRSSLEDLSPKVEVSTIHSFLAKRDWLNDNFTFRRSGGKQEGAVQIYIIDESSMLDLSLAATFYRAVNWKTVQRPILVGDPNQLPPIGRGKIFKDIIDWLNSHNSQSVGILQKNVRQLLNKQKNEGTGIVQLASLYKRSMQTDQKNLADKFEAEELLQKVQEGGHIDKDLKVIYWDNLVDLKDKLLTQIITDLEEDTGKKYNPVKPYELLDFAFKRSESGPEYMQILTPYRGAESGTDFVNNIFQKHFRSQLIERTGLLEGVGLFDKVMQTYNRSGRSSICAYNAASKKSEFIEVFNGELGFVKPHAFDKNWSYGSSFYLKRFQVTFARKENLWVGYGKELGNYFTKTGEKRNMPKEKVEENLELAYAISVHKAQGSEFERVYFIVPKSKSALLSPELFYTGLTRARRSCTIFVEQDIMPLVAMRRPENSHLLSINSSLFDFKPLPPELLWNRTFGGRGKIYPTLADYIVRSKAEVLIANILLENEIEPLYEEPLQASDGTVCWPDFTINWRGDFWYWEHFGMVNDPVYRQKTDKKKAWYDKHFPGRLVFTENETDLKQSSQAIVDKYFS